MAATDHQLRLSCADQAFPLLTHEGALAVIAYLGLPAVDLCMFPGQGHITCEAAIADPRGTVELVKRRLEPTGLAVADLFAVAGEPGEGVVNHPDPNVRRGLRESFARLVEIAVGVGAPGITVLPGIPLEHVDPAEGLELAAAELQLRAELAGEAGLRLSVEPHYESIAETPEAARTLMEMAPDLSLTLDPSHFIFQGYDQAAVQRLIEHAGHVHLRQAAEGAMQARLEQGAIDFVAFRDALLRAGYDGYLTLEYLWEEWFDAKNVDCISETALLRDALLS